ncbi:hypothetical protein Sango_3037700 [Sesamum angolense]|uniref:DUF4283 domain-containing protein n=1 Tax=Sesamum angolense TaxID=2727404 RepID=A0AAE1W0P9_9LAMI|nr:hypothetical protein Sango_3037700 [Sesamum angolense]
MVEEGEEEGELEDGSHGVGLAAPATVPAVDEGEDGELQVGDHGAVSAAPTKIPAAKSELNMEKLKTEFNFNEFIELALRVIDNGDSESKEMLKALKKQWKEKLGGELTSAGHGGFRRVQTRRQLTPFSSRKSRPARRFINGAELMIGASGNKAPKCITAQGTLQDPLTAASLADAAVTAGASFNEAPNFSMAHGIRPLAAANSAAAALLTGASCNEAPKTFIAHGAARRLVSAPTLTAASLDADKLPRLRRPTPLTATSIIDDESSLTPRNVQAPAEHPSPTPFLAVPTVKDHLSPSADSLFGLNGAFHHRSPVGSPPPSVQPAAAATLSLPWDRGVKTLAPAPLPAPLCRTQPPPAAPPVTTRAPANRLPEIFIGNVPLNPQLASNIDEDKIAAAFHNSSRKTLNFIPPSVQNGEVIVRPSIDMIRAGSKRWNTTAVGYFLGKKPYFHHLNEFVRSIWPGVRDVKATSNGFFFFQFETVAAMEEVIEGGPWLYLGQPIVLQKWEPGMVLRKMKHTEVPVWIKLRHLPVELWMT